MLDVCLLGTGGMMPLPGRWLTSLLTRYNGHSLLIDCGEGTQIAIREAGQTFKPIDILCITHFHADHISGFLGVILSMMNSGKTDPLFVIGPKGLEKVLQGLCVVCPALPFEIRLFELETRETVLNLCGYKITAFKVNHNMVCYGYTLEIERSGRFDVERAKAAGIPLKLWNPLQKGNTVEFEGKTYTPDMVLGTPRKGLKLTYTTDTRPTDSIRKHAEEADLFICEGMYGEAEKQENALQNKHMTMQEACHLALDAKVKELWLTHYSPSLSAPGRYRKELKSIFPEVHLGRDGRSTILNFEDEKDDQA